MKIFEFHFNPKAKEDLIFDSFCYEPENVYEKRLGSLFLVGELKNALPQNLKFLNNLASHLKNEYYSAPIKFSPEEALKIALKKSNEFLEGIAKSGDVSWLGNLNLAILNFKNFDLNCTKVGTVKILLLRQGQIIDIGKNLEFEEIEPYPLKIFDKIVSGKLTEGDIVLVQTKEVFDFFSSYNLLKEIAKISPLDEKKLKVILKNNEKELLKISGICLLLYLTKEVWPKIEKPKAFAFQSKTVKFSFKKALSPLISPLKQLPILKNLRFLKELKLVFKKALSGFGWLKSAPQVKEAKIKKTKIAISFKKLKVKFSTIFKKSITSRMLDISGVPPVIVFRKGIILVLSLIFILVFGFLIFKREDELKLKKYQLTLSNIRQNISQAENYLTLENEKNAFLIYKKAWQDVLEIIKVTKEGSPLQRETISLKNSIQENLEKISKLEKISEPKLLFAFDEKEFIPQKMILFEKNLYLFSPYADNIYKLSFKGEKNVIQTNQRFNEATIFNNQILFFKKPNLIFFLNNDQLSQPLTLKIPYSDFDPKTLAVFHSSLYFLDEKRGEIIKYPAPLIENLNFPQTWLAKETKKVTDAKSMTIDGPIWILNKDNTISQYYSSNFKKTLTLDFFPWPENLSKITALYELFYVLEPSQKRIIILNRAGEIVKQFQSEKFDNLKDFAISEDGKTIYLLNGLKIYQLSK